MGESDLESCGEFLVLVSALLELKARLLFDEEAAELAELEPEQAAEELARRLAAYRRMKEAAAWLASRLDHEQDRFFRLGPAPLRPSIERPIDPQDPAALAAAMRVLATPPKVFRSPTCRFAIHRSSSSWGASARCSPSAVVSTSKTSSASLSRVEQAVAFLALLELGRLGEIAISQAAPFAPIRVERRNRERSPAWKSARSA